jgi:NAD+ diphosphatase
MNSRTLAFTGGTLLRQSESRDERAIVGALAHDQAKILAFAGPKPLLRFEGDQVSCWHLKTPAMHLDEDKAILLGHDERGTPWLAAPSLLDFDHLPDGMRAVDLRTIIAQGLIASAELGNLAYGAALHNWHSTNAFCSRCGAASVLAAGGAKRVCKNCKAEHFPRTDPVAIMLVTYENKCLLGRSPHFPPGMYSCLAGFIEAGETIEEAVRRETFEESGITLGEVTYVASQPWPMPHSLMIGCFAEALTDTIHFDPNELEDCRWCNKAELAMMLDGTHPDGLTAPLEGAIARYLMAAWVEG